MWMRVDDGLPTHRKTRAVLKSHPEKTRDAAPLGIWALAGAWAGKNRTDGWVPEDELDRWDDDWQPLVERLVDAGFWWPHERDGEPGYGFNDWHDYNDPADAASKAGTFGNHVRWHVNEKKVDPECEHCPKEPEPVDDRPDIGGRSGGDSHPESGGESRTRSGAIALPEPPPETRTRPEPRTTLPDKSGETDITPDRFEEFWETYSHKVGRKKAEAAYRAALKKADVTEDLLIASAAAYIAWQVSEGKHPEFTKHPTTWLHGEHWRDERPARQAPRTRVQQHLQLARDLAAEEQGQMIQFPQIGESR